MDYDVIFIGSGHSCNHGGLALAAAGKKVAFVECGKMHQLRLRRQDPAGRPL